MNEGISRYAIGFVPLTVLAVIAVILTANRGIVPKASGAHRRVLAVYAAVFLLQVLHFLEERFAGFPDALPELFGLSAWSDRVFISVNVVWIVIWLFAGAGFVADWRIAYFPVWFLALAAFANGIAHPALALTTGDYFPGLWSSLALGVGGAALTAMLFRNTSEGSEP